MKKLVITIAALACLTAAPLLSSSANAQVSVGVGRDGPSVRIGHENDRDEHRDRDRRNYRSERHCHDEIVRTQHRDGSETVRTVERCN